MKLITKKEIIPIGLILIVTAIGIGLYTSSCLPDQIATHWNAQGEVDGYSSKAFAVFFFPALTIGLYLLFILLPFIDPFKKNYEKFANIYFGFRLLFITFLVLLYLYTLMYGMGYIFDVRLFMIPMMALLFVIIGLFLPKVKRNWFAGIRTPWTLQNDEVWAKTHEFGGKTFIFIGIFATLTMFLGKYSFPVFTALVIAGALAPAFYSYWVYRKMGLFKK